MDSHTYAFLFGFATAAMLWVTYHLMKILLERDDVSYRCIQCGHVVKSMTGFDRLTELQYAAHRVFRQCSHLEHSSRA